MKTRSSHHLGRPISEIGLGCWQLGGGDWGSLDEKLADEILRTAVESGITFFDTADVYGSGRSEELIGRFLAETGHDIFVATKLGRTSDLFPANYTEAGVRQAIERSLRRLRRDTLDLTQLHCVPPAILQQGDIFEWLRTLQQEGKIRHFGASVESMDEGLLCLQQEGLASLQIIFNLFRQKPITTLFAQAAEKKVALIIRLPLASGLLSGRMTRETQFPENDHRHYNRDGQAFNVGETFAGLPYEIGVDLADELKSLVPAGLTMAQMAQRWILDYPAVSVIITGASRPDQARANASASDLPELGETLHRRLADFYESRVANQIRGPY